jgi:tetraacyldisaccharide 4'-kinase
LIRDIEIVLIDHARYLGNKQLLPAGPLREPASRLNEVSFVVRNGGQRVKGVTMTLVPDRLVSLSNPQYRMRLADFSSRRVHAVAAIGHPEQFFLLLKKAGLDVVPHVFPDHYFYRPADICFPDTLPIIMTEKDAVKCRAFVNSRHWYLRVTAELDDVFQQQLRVKLKELGASNEFKENRTGIFC